MAFWAFWLLIASLVGILISGFGVVLLIRSIGLGRQANIEATKAANAAIEMNEIARLESRPWAVLEIDFKGYFSVQESYIPGYDLHIKRSLNYWPHNRGLSTAHNTEIAYEWICADYWQEGTSHLRLLADGEIGRTIRRHGPIFAGDKLDLLKTVSVNHIKKNTPSSSFFTLLLCIRYSDASGKLKGVDARAFVLQQIGPSIGPWISEYRNDGEARITE